MPSDAEIIAGLHVLDNVRFKPGRKYEPGDLVIEILEAAEAVRHAALEREVKRMNDGSFTLHFKDDE